MRYLRYLIFTFFTVHLSLVSQGQNGFSPVHLGEEVNTEHAELAPVLSPDGQTLYFSRANHPLNSYGNKDSQDIWFATLQPDGSWSEASRLPYPFNTARYNALLAISADGKNYYVNGVFYKDLTWKSRGLSVIRHLGGNDFSAPECVKIKGYSRMNKGRYTNISINEREDIMLLSFSRNWGGVKNNLYIATRSKNNKKWNRPKKISKPVRTGESELAPFISAEGKRLYFTRKKDKHGDWEILFSDSKDESLKQWSEPMLATDLNTSGSEMYLRTNSKGSYAYFASTNNSKGSSDIFRVKLFEEHPYVLLSGKVINKLRGDIVKSEDLEITVNGSNPEDLEYDLETGTFSLRLPLGENHTIKASRPHYDSEPLNIDLTKEKEHASLTKDLQIVAHPNVRLTGKIKVKDEQEMLNTSHNPTVLVNGKPAKNFEMQTDGSFTMEVEHGKTYVLTTQAKGFNKGDVKLDLRDIHDYKEIEKDLLVNRIPPPKILEATITGKIVNTKTFKALEPEVKVDILLNEYPATNVVFTDSIYTLTVPLGQVYNINAAAENHYPVMETIDLSKEKDKIKIYKDLFITPLEKGISVKLDNIFFETGKATLKQESFTELDRVVRLLNDYPKIKIEIAGHTDNVGSAELNKKLSQDRANAVMNYITSKGIDTQKVVAIGYGLENPVADNKTAEGRSQNRRVEFTILDN